MTRDMAALALALTMIAYGIDGAAEVSAPSNGPTLALGGDVFIDSPIQNTLHRRSFIVGRLQAYRELLADVEPSLRAADLTVVNLENPVSPRYRDRGPGESPTFNAPPELLEALSLAGVDAITLANNHAYDQGYRGLRDTVDQARRLGLAVVGVGRTAEEAAGPITVPTPGGDVSICAWTQGFNRIPRPQETNELVGSEPLHVALIEDGTMERCLSEARARSTLVVASIHWTSGVWNSPGRDERRLALDLADAGADVIMGHGSHRPAPAVRVRAADGRQVQVLFSLGNLVGAMGLERSEWNSTHPSVRDAAVALVRSRRDDRGRLDLQRLDLIPLWMSGILTSAPWWSEGRQELIRPLSVARELERLDAARCGVLCQRRAAGYRRRLAAFHKAVSFEGSWPERSTTSPEPEPAPEPVAAPTPIAAPAPVPEPAPTAEPEPAAEAPQLSTSSSLPPVVTRVDQLDIPSLLQGVTLPVRFPHDRIHGEIRNEEVIEGLVELLQSHRGLSAVLIGHGVEGETEMPLDRLGRRRARSVAWELAGRGPSRRRFTWEDGPPLPAGEEGRVVLRLTE